LTAGRFPNLAKKFGKHADEWSQWGSISQKAFYNRAVQLADGLLEGIFMDLLQSRAGILDLTQKQVSF